MKSKKVMGLFAKLETLRSVSIKNYLIELFMVILHLSIVGLGMYTFLGLNERPYEYGIFASVLVVLFAIFYAVFFYCIYKVESYKEKVNIVLDGFEEEHQCKVRIRK